jgi:deazaflavin-dependent oxidoreductase (nitroreductase family)
MVLLLTTIGRRTGKLRITPLQYEKIGEDYYVGAARGMKTDWLRNIQSDPVVTVRIGDDQFHANAEIIRDQEIIADFLALKLSKHPRFVGAIMRMAGFPKNPDREDLRTYAKDRVLVILHPA